MDSYIFKTQAILQTRRKELFRVYMQIYDNGRIMFCKCIHWLRVLIVFFLFKTKLRNPFYYISLYLGTFYCNRFFLMFFFLYLQHFQFNFYFLFFFNLNFFHMLFQHSFSQQHILIATLNLFSSSLLYSI